MLFSKEGTTIDTAGMQEVWAKLPLAEAGVARKRALPVARDGASRSLRAITSAGEIEQGLRDNGLRVHPVR